MTGSVQPRVASLLMDLRDVTKWVSTIRLRQTKRTYYRKLEVVFQGWHSIPSGARFDLYTTTDPAQPYLDLEFRGGIIPPDDRGVIDLTTGEVVPLSVNIYDWAWSAQKKAHPNTIVVAPDFTSARIAVDKHGGPVGKYTVVRAATLHQAVRSLGALAGFSVENWIPDYKFSAKVFEPELSLWEMIWNLVEPFAPDVFFRREVNAVVFADILAQAYQVGAAQGFGPAAIAGLKIVPDPRLFLVEAEPRRLIVRIAA